MFAKKIFLFATNFLFFQVVYTQTPQTDFLSTETMANNKMVISFYSTEHFNFSMSNFENYISYENFDMCRHSIEYLHSKMCKNNCTTIFENGQHMCKCEDNFEVKQIYFRLIRKCCMVTENRCEINFVKERFQEVCQPSKCFY